MESLTKTQLLIRIAMINRHMLYVDVIDCHMEGDMLINNDVYEYIVKGAKVEFYFKEDPEVTIFKRSLKSLTRDQLEGIFFDSSDAYNDCNRNCRCRKKLIQ